jgi:hypothetical protein
MESLTIRVASRESAEGYCGRLCGFGAQLIEVESGRYEVRVPLMGSDRQIVAVLTALEVYVTERDDGPARVELNGRDYMMQPLAETR